MCLLRSHYFSVLFGSAHLHFLLSLSEVFYYCIHLLNTLHRSYFVFRHSGSLSLFKLFFLKKNSIFSASYVHDTYLPLHAVSILVTFEFSGFMYQSLCSIRAKIQLPKLGLSYYPRKCVGRVVLIINLTGTGNS